MDEEVKQKIETIKRNLKFIEIDSKLLRDIINKHEGVRERAIKYVYQLITIIGVVAGFGFTAISSVKTLLPFVVGELSLIFAVAVGMRFIRSGFIDEADIYATYISKLGSIMDERRKLKLEDSIEILKTKMDSITARERMVFEDEKHANLDSNFTLNIISYLFTIGGLSIVFSFTAIMSIIMQFLITLERVASPLYLTSVGLVIDMFGAAILILPNVKRTRMVDDEFTRSIL